MKIAGFGPIIASTYTDTMSIYRHRNVMNEDGTQGIEMVEESLYSEVKCRLSFESRDYPESDLDDVNPIHLQLKIFCEPTVDIREGDRLVVNRLDESGNIMMSYEGIANLPFTYVTHKEVEIVEVGVA